MEADSRWAPDRGDSGWRAVPSWRFLVSIVRSCTINPAGGERVCTFSPNGGWRKTDWHRDWERWDAKTPRTSPAPGLQEPATSRPVWLVFFFFFLERYGVSRRRRWADEAAVSLFNALIAGASYLFFIIFFILCLFKKKKQERWKCVHSSFLSSTFFFWVFLIFFLHQRLFFMRLKSVNSETNTCDVSFQSEAVRRIVRIMMDSITEPERETSK